MSKSFVFVMDPVEKINIRTDTSFAFMLTAFERGHHVFHTTHHELSLRGNVPYITASKLEIYDRVGDHYRVTETKTWPVNHFDAIFIRTDPPFDDDYLRATWILSFAEALGVRVINSPKGIRSANEKLYALYFHEVCPKTLVSAKPADIVHFVEECGGEAIAKPIDGHGGYGVVRLKRNDSNIHALIDLLTQEGKKAIVTQAYLPEAAQGDKRLILIDGILRGALQRVPPKDDHRGNVHVGGCTVACDINQSDRYIAEKVGPRVRQDGLFFVGLDVIGDKLIEINVTSPTLVQELKNLGGPDLALEVILSLEQGANGDVHPL
jgi:glutathione synthase